jgi:hypothetical protein
MIAFSLALLTTLQYSQLAISPDISLQLRVELPFLAPKTSSLLTSADRSFWFLGTPIVLGGAKADSMWCQRAHL